MILCSETQQGQMDWSSAIKKAIRTFQKKKLVALEQEKKKFERQQDRLAKVLQAKKEMIQQGLVGPAVLETRRTQAVMPRSKVKGRSEADSELDIISDDESTVDERSRRSTAAAKMAAASSASTSTTAVATTTTSASLEGGADTLSFMESPPGVVLQPTPSADVRVPPAPATGDGAPTTSNVNKLLESVDTEDDASDDEIAEEAAAGDDDKGPASSRAEDDAAAGSSTAPSLRDSSTPSLSLSGGAPAFSASRAAQVASPRVLTRSTSTLSSGSNSPTRGAAAGGAAGAAAGGGSSSGSNSPHTLLRTLSSKIAPIIDLTDDQKLRLLHQAPKVMQVLGIQVDRTEADALLLQESSVASPKALTKLGATPTAAASTSVLPLSHARVQQGHESNQLHRAQSLDDDRARREKQRLDEILRMKQSILQDIVRLLDDGWRRRDAAAF